MPKCRDTAPSPAELKSRFKKGKTKTGGRKKGSPNRQTMVLEIINAMWDGMEVSGGDHGVVGYLRWLAAKHPRLFATILLKILPTSADDMLAVQLKERVAQREREIEQQLIKNCNLGTVRGEGAGLRSRAPTGKRRTEP